MRWAGKAGLLRHARRLPFVLGVMESLKGWRRGRPSASERLLGGWGGGQEQGDQQGGDGSHPGETAVALTKVQT